MSNRNEQLSNSNDNSVFNLSPEEISDILNLYQHKSKHEEVDKLKLLGGSLGLCERLKTDISTGLMFSNDNEELQYNSDFQRRVKYYGNNKNSEDDEISFWSLISEALGDFMIQVLIVAAIVQIAIGVSPLAESPTDWIDGVAIIFAILVVVITSAVTNHGKEKQFQNLKKVNQSMFNLIALRKGKTIQISSEDVVVGDIIKLEYGMILPCDGILLKGENVEINEAAMTGESDDLSKESIEKCSEIISSNTFLTSFPSPVLISGTTVYSGSGWFVSVAVGKNSVKGKIGEIILKSKEESQSPLEVKLGDIANDIGLFGLFSALLTFAALTCKLVLYKYEQYHFHKDGNQAQDNARNSNYNSTLYNNTYSDEYLSYNYYKNPSSVFDGLPKEVLSILMLCVAIIVVAIPEGLPLAVTLALSFSIRKMMKDNNLVRHLTACETMGGANYILTDKTGTLTEGVMTVSSLFNNSNIINIDKRNDNNNNLLNSLASSKNYISKLVENISCNIDVEIDNEGKQTSGSITDFALYNFLTHNLNSKIEEAKKNYKVLEKIPFNSSRKKASTLIIKQNNNSKLIHMKGAFEIVIKSCSRILKDDNKIQQLTSKHLENIEKITNEYTSNSQRCIALAYKEILNSNFEYKKTHKDSTSILPKYESEESNFILIGIIAINDSLKKNVFESIQTCNKSGINIVMITGDNINTAVSIAKSCNIIKEKDYDKTGIALTGNEFYNFIGGIKCRTCKKEDTTCLCLRSERLIDMIDSNNDRKADVENLNNTNKKIQDLGVGNMTNFCQIVQDLKVLARASPKDKYALVLGLKELNNVVAVTGDGTNDAQALSKADVGFAMGIKGTDIAKNSADIIILDDNFSSVVSSIKWGRNIFDNIRKFIQFQLSVNLSAVLLVFVTSWIGSESPISPIQMLWLNLIMDSLGSLALATEPPSDELLLRKPYSRREYIVNQTMLKHVITQSLVQFSIVFFLYIYAEKFIIEEHADKIAVSRQLENCFGDFSAEIVRYHKHSMLYYILDGKKSSWSAINLIKPNLDPNYCMFYDKTAFPEGDIRNLEDAYKWYISNFGNTTHMTIIFNCFVLYSLFNQINCRILDDSYNIFARISKSWLFIFVFLVELTVQILLVEYGGLVFKCAVGGLTTFQWGLCILFSSITFWIALFVKFIPINKIGKQKSDSKRISNLYDMKQELIVNEHPAL